MATKEAPVEQLAGMGATSEVAPSALDVEILVVGGHTCHICDVPFGLVRDLTVHLRQVHQLSGSEIRAVARRADSPAPESPPEPAGPVRCPLCPALAVSPARARAHLRLKHRAELEAGVSLPPELVQHVCGQCGIAFRTEHKYRKHAATHRALPPANQCELCSTRLQYRATLRRHLTARHGLSEDHPAVRRAAAPAPQPCHLCSSVFADYAQYLFHYRREHGSEADVGVGCDVCGRRFQTPSELRRHAESHADTSYSCVACDRHFRTRLALQKHERTHGSGGWRCPRCDKVFDTGPNLRSHLQTHSEQRAHVCDECGAAYKFKQTLDRHKRTRHAVDVPAHECDVCGKTFKVAHSLTLHRRRHGSASQTCALCPARFTSRADLRRHERRRHDGYAPAQGTLETLTPAVDGGATMGASLVLRLAI